MMNRTLKSRQDLSLLCQSSILKRGRGESEHFLPAYTVRLKQENFFANTLLSFAWAIFMRGHTCFTSTLVNVVTAMSFHVEVQWNPSIKATIGE